MKIYGTESNDYILKELGKRIQDIRISVTITQRELAERAGVSPSTMERIENGENVKIENIMSVIFFLRERMVLVFQLFKLVKVKLMERQYIDIFILV